MTAELVLGSGSSATSSLAYTTVTTDADYPCDGDVDIVTAQADCVVTLDPNPIKGRSITVAAAEGANVTVTGGAFPITDGDILLNAGHSVECTFTGEGWAVHGAGNAILTASDVYIDAVSGSDANAGTSASKALRTVAELARRIGAYGTLRPAGGVMTVHVLTDLPDDDQVSLHAIILANTVLLLQGSLVVVRSGVVTAFTPLDRDANDAAILASPGIGAAVGERIIFTSGAAKGYSLWVAKDLGGDTARVSPAVLVSSPQTGNAFSDQEPAAGDTYDVVRSVSVVYGNTDIQIGSSDSTLESWFQLRDLSFRSTPFLGAVYLNDQGVICVGCRFEAFLAVNGGTFRGFNNGFLYTAFLQAGPLFNASRSFSGLFLESSLQISCGGKVWVCEDAVFQGGPAQGPYPCILVQTAGTLDVCFAGIFDSNNDGIRIEGSGAAFAREPPFDSPHHLYGKGQAGAGVAVSSGGQFLYNGALSTTIEGAGGPGANDFTLGGSNSVRPFNNAAGTYSAPITTSWANLALASPAGFGGYALDPVSGALAAQNS